MHKKHNKFLMISFVLVIILGVYSYFYKDFTGEVFSADSSLTSSLGTTGVTTTANDVSAKAAEDTAFLMKLASLTQINIDATLFSEPSFILLVDNNVKLDNAPYGRVNPFSPTNDSSSVNRAVITLTTNAASAITSKSAVLNGTLDGATSNNIYFEYGLTNTFGKVTSKATVSLVGNFGSTLSGLTGKTTYFYRAAANINGALSYGEIMSFNTN